VDIVERGQGTIRIWRQWLIDRCTELYEAEQNGMSNEDIALTSTTRCPAFRSDPTIKHHDCVVNARPSVLDDESLACNVEIQGKPDGLRTPHYLQDTNCLQSLLYELPI